MSTTTLPGPAAGAARSLPRSAGQVTFGGAMRSEFTKLWSVRSTYWSLLLMLVLVAGFAAIAGVGAVTNLPVPKNWDPTQHSLFGLYLGQLVIGVLGVLVISSEYATGMIRTTLTANPHRGVMIAAKAAVFTVTAFAASLITALGAFFLGQAILATKHINTTITSPHVPGAILGAALFLTLCGLIGFGFGLLLRYTAAGLGATVGVLFVLTVLVNFLPTSWQNDIARFVPALAGAQLWTTRAAEGPFFAPAGSFAVLCGWVALALIPALVRYRRRDA